MNTLIIDNYDSYTFNLYQMISKVVGCVPVVIRNDQYTWEEILTFNFDNIVISPGPGSPTNRDDFGICFDALVHAKVPILGVCLGHQGFGHVYGGTVKHAPEPMHGRTSKVWHNGSPLFVGIPQGFQVVRYHSLMVDTELPSSLIKTAWTEDNIIMGLQHVSLPIFGVQFHPESICTEFGEELLKNFNTITQNYLKQQKVLVARGK